MSKTALLFAGQGAQVVGMGQDLAAQFPRAQRWFERANAALGYDLANLCFAGPEAELTKTEHAQPGIFLASWVALSGFLKRIDRSAKMSNVAGLASLDRTVAAWSGGPA